MEISHNNQSDEFVAQTKLFLSVDIAGSTKLKHTYDIAALGKRIQRRDLFLQRLTREGHITSKEEVPPCKMLEDSSTESHDWIAILKIQFEDFDAEFQETIKNKFQEQGYDYPYKSEDPIWKCLGDEIIYCFRITTEKEAHTLCKAFLETLHNFDTKAVANEKSKSNTEILRVKGTAWLAHFPIRNRSTTLFKRPDYFGLDMDIGFRIAKFAMPGVLCVNFDLAYLFANHTASDKKNTFKGGIVGWEELRGVWNGIKYPIIWLLDEECSPDSIQQSFPEWYTAGDQRIKKLKKIVNNTQESRLTSQETQTTLTKVYEGLSHSLNLPEPNIIDSSNLKPEFTKQIDLLNSINKGQGGTQDWEKNKKDPSAHEGFVKEILQKL